MCRAAREIIRDFGERVWIPKVVLSSVRNRLLVISVSDAEMFFRVELILDVVSRVQPFAAR
jgi:hypothetical protein